MAEYVTHFPPRKKESRKSDYRLVPSSEIDTQEKRLPTLVFHWKVAFKGNKKRNRFLWNERVSSSLEARLCFSTKGRRLWAVSCAFIMRVKTPPFLFFPASIESHWSGVTRYNGPRMERRRHSSHLPGLDKLIYFDIIVSGLSRICSGEFRGVDDSMIPDHGGQYLPRTSMKCIHRCFTTLPSPLLFHLFVFSAPFISSYRRPRRFRILFSSFFDGTVIHDIVKMLFRGF